MLPIIVIVGRPNVGKSTLFNRLTRSRDAIVADVPGMTRDRHYGHGRVGGKPYLVVDTGGFEPVGDGGHLPRDGAPDAPGGRRGRRRAVHRRRARGPDAAGPHHRGRAAQDRAPHHSWSSTRPKAWRRRCAGAEFHALGLGDPLPISAAHGENVSDLMELVLADFPPAEATAQATDRASAHRGRRPAQRRQVDAGQCAARRGARHRVRPARHDARFDLRRVRARRPALHADRHGRRAPARARVGRGGEVLGGEDDAGDRGCERRHPGARCARRRSRSRMRTSPASSSRPGARWCSRSTSGSACRRSGARHVKRTLARKLDFLSFARLHFISALAGQGIGAAA